MVDTTFVKGYLYGIIGVLYEVHKELGPGLNEKVYQEGVMLELKASKIPFLREYSFHPLYKGKVMNSDFRLDFLVNNDVILELKSVSAISDEHRSQLFNYMRLCKPIAGILVNFANKSCEVERYIYDRELDVVLNVKGFPINRK